MVKGGTSVRDLRHGGDGATRLIDFAGGESLPISANFAMDGRNRSVIHEEDGLKHPSLFRHCMA